MSGSIAAKTRKPNKRGPAPSRKPVSPEDAASGFVSLKRLKAALARHDGNMAAAARQVGLSRVAVWQRVHNNPALQEWIAEHSEGVGDMVESNIVGLCRDKDGPMLRFYADRKLRHRGYGLRVDHEDKTPPNPEAERERFQAINMIGKLIEERARAGLPPLFAKNGSQPPLIEVMARPASKGEDE